VAYAQPDNEAEAKRLYQEGTKHYQLAEYDQAVADYKAAYQIVPKPLFLYNIAQAYRLAQNHELALRFYKNFLSAQPAASNRAEVEEHIRTMEEAIAAKARSAPPSPSPSPVIPSPVEAAELGAQADGAPAPAPADGPRPLYKRWWVWAGVGVVLVAATTVLVLTMDGGGGPPSSELGSHKVFE